MTSYTVKLYKRSGSADTLVSTKTATIPANKTSGMQTFSITFPATGAYTLYAEVYNEYGRLIATSTDTETVIVTGKWKITVELTADRTQLGIIKLFNASGLQLSQSVCLGKSANNLPMNQTNGHTPIGIYIGQLSYVRADTDAYGPYKVISIEGVSGYVVTDCSHREYLLIHGGRESYYEGLEIGDPNFRLCATYGCVRVTNEYQFSLQNDITSLILSYHDSQGTVIVTQDGATTL